MQRHSSLAEAAYQTLRRYARQVALQALYQADVQGPAAKAEDYDLFLLGRLQFNVIWPADDGGDADRQPPDPADADDLLETLRAELQAVAQEIASRDGQPYGDSPELARALAHDQLTLFVDQQGLQFARRLVRGVLTDRETLDQSLGGLALHWSMDRMAATDRNVLRIGAHELRAGETPPVVAINEAVELAKRFGAAQSSQFVNGILDKLYRQERET